MMPITIDFKTPSTITDALLEMPEYEKVAQASLMNKIGLGSKEQAQLYFHQGALDKKSTHAILHAHATIVNSQRSKAKVLQTLKELDEQSVEVIYPTFEPQEIDIKEAKKAFLDELQLPKKTRLILFTANNLKTAGVKEFIQTIMSLQARNFRVIIASDKQQITALKFQISKYNFDDTLILYEDFHNMDLLFAVSDIFVLPTHNTTFSTDILKAMYYKSAVFTTANSASCEVVDVFATMSDPSDASLPFKMDALLSRKEDLKLIKKQNRKIAKKFILSKALQTIARISEPLKLGHL